MQTPQSGVTAQFSTLGKIFGNAINRPPPHPTAWIAVIHFSFFLGRTFAVRTSFNHTYQAVTELKVGGRVALI
jgi:hypothetical protein